MTATETVISLEEKNDLTTGSVPPTESAVRAKGPAVALTQLGSSPIFLSIGALLSLIIPLLQLYIGWRYADECPINPKIPKYLFVAGAVGIVSAILNQIRTYLSAKSMKSSEEPADRKTGITAAVGVNNPGVSVITIITCFLNIFLIVWFIFGCIWIFGAWSHVRYDYPDHPQFCSALVYRFAYILILIPIVFLFVCCCCPFCLATTAAIGMRAQGA
ncbi:hypothetical protein I4U23_015545 [Adineta vaga]|nr:hypothetical protein I4U23_015545 [Adineta vaga]